MNSVIITPTSNSVETSLFDIHTTAYFLQAHTMIEEHRPVKTAPDKEAELDEL